MPANAPYIAVFCLSLTLITSTTASAQIVFSEDFNYPTGPLAGPWTTICSGAQVDVKTPGLVYPGYTGSGIGNAAEINASGSEHKLSSNFSVAGPVFMGFLFNVASVGSGGGATCGQGMERVINFRVSGGGGSALNLSTGLIVKSFNSSQFWFGIEGPSSGQILTTLTYSVNTTYLIVLALVGTDYLLYINPPLDGSNPTPDLIYPIGTTYTTADNIVLGQNNYGRMYLDGLRVSSSFSDLTPNVLSTEPINPPNTLVFGNATSGSLSGSFLPGQDNPTGALVVRNTNAPVSFEPMDGAGYSPGQDVGGGNIIVSSGCCAFSESSLLPETYYYYKLFSYNQNGAASTTNYLTASSLEGSRYTLSSTPSSHPSFFTATAVSSSQINLSFPSVSTIANADGYVLIGRTDGTNPTGQSIVNGLSPGAQQLSPGSSVRGYTQGGSITVFNDVSLAGGKLHNYAVVAYNWDGVNEATFNYNISGSIRTASALTFPGAPTFLPATGTTQSSFTANWSPVTGADSYTLDVSLNNFTTVLISVPGITGTSKAVSGLNAGTAHQCVVRAKNTSGSSINSTVIVINTAPTSPAAPFVSQVLSNSFVVNWTAAPGVVSHYELEVSKDNFVTFVSSYGPKVVAAPSNFEGVSGLSGSTFYKFRVKAVNSGGSSLPVESGAYTLPQVIPVIVNQVFDPAFKGSAVPVSTQISNASIISVVQLKHRKVAADANYVAETLTQSSGKFDFTVSNPMLDELGMEFYVVAQDGGWKDSTAIKKIYPVFDNQSSPVFISGEFSGAPQDYQMVSIPYDLTDNLVESIFDKVLGAYNSSRWRLGHYENGQMLEFGKGISRIVRGKAYWFNARVTGPISIHTGAGEAPKNDRSHPYQLSLLKGWNQVGNPYPFAINWSEVLQANPGVSGVSGLKVFSGGTYDNGNTMPIFSGGFVFTENPVTLSMPVGLHAQGSRQADNDDEEVPIFTEDQWQVKLHVKQEKRQNKLAGFGMHPKAKAGKDDFDDLNLPRLNDFLEVVFHHPEYFFSSFSRDIIPTTPQHTWKFTIESSEGGTTELRWPNISGQQVGPKLFLLDVQTGMTVDMQSEGSYSFDMNEKSRDFQIFFAIDKNSEIQFDALHLGNAYPNPALATATIPFILPTGKDYYSVDLSIYNLSGQKSRTLTQVQVAPGLHQAFWDGTDDTGNPVAGGVYFYRMSVDGKSENSVKRVMMFK